MECPECSARLPRAHRQGCAECGWKPDRTPPVQAPAERLTACTGCGSPLDEVTRRCRQTGHFSGHLNRVPGQACPDCRRPVAFSGQCEGCSPPRLPGDRYEWAEGHWVLADKGPGRWATLDEAQAAVRAIGVRMEGIDTGDRTRQPGDPVPIGAVLAQTPHRVRR